jgi:hypothetical protein
MNTPATNMRSWRLSQLTGRRVVDEQGHAHGRVVDVRSQGEPETQPRKTPREVEALLYGRRGLLERLGWVEPTSEEVLWRDVDVLGAHTIRIDAEALGNAKKRQDDSRRYARVEARRAAEEAKREKQEKPAATTRKAAKKSAKNAKKAKPRKAHSDEPQRARKGSSNSRERRK